MWGDGCYGLGLVESERDEDDAQQHREKSLPRRPRKQRAGPAERHREDGDPDDEQKRSDVDETLLVLGVGRFERDGPQAEEEEDQ